MPMNVVTIVDNHSSAMREKPPPPKKMKIFCRKNIKVNYYQTFNLNNTISLPLPKKPKIFCRKKN